MASPAVRFLYTKSPRYRLKLAFKKEQGDLLFLFDRVKRGVRNRKEQEKDCFTIARRLI